MLTQSELDAMRATSQSALPDQGTVTRQGTVGVFDPDTGEYPAPVPETIYEGPCRVRREASVEKDVEVGRLPETLGSYVATFPWDVGDLQVDDFLTLTSSSDPDIVGRPLRITNIYLGSWSIDRRVSLEDALRQPRPVEGGS